MSIKYEVEWTGNDSFDSNIYVTIDGSKIPFQFTVDDPLKKVGQVFTTSSKDTFKVVSKRKIPTRIGNNHTDYSYMIEKQLTGGKRKTRKARKARKASKKGTRRA
jgi:hypothetical protein